MPASAGRARQAQVRMPTERDGHCPTPHTRVARPSSPEPIARIATSTRQPAHASARGARRAFPALSLWATSTFMPSGMVGLLSAFCEAAWPAARRSHRLACLAALTGAGASPAYAPASTCRERSRWGGAGWIPRLAKRADHPQRVPRVASMKVVAHLFTACRVKPVRQPMYRPRGRGFSRID